MKPTILSRKEPNLRSKHPRLLKRSWPALWWAPQLRFGVETHRFGIGFDPSISHGATYTEQALRPAFSWGYVFRHLLSSRRFRKLGKTEGIFLRKIAKKFRGFPPGGGEVARFIGSEGKHGLHRFPRQNAPWLFVGFVLVPTRNVRSGFWKERQPGLW